jgi:integrase
MQKGQKATNSAHRGVQVIKKGANLVLRFKDPITRKYRDQSLGPVSRQDAVAAAISKREALLVIKQRYLSGDLNPAPADVDQLQEFVDSSSTEGTKGVRLLGVRYLRVMQEGMQTRSWHELQRHDLIRLHRIILADSKLGPTTKNLRIKTCKSFLNWMNDRGSLGAFSREVITQCLKSVKAPDHSHGRILNPQELQILFATMLKQREDIALFFLLKLLLGLRSGEIVNVRANDLVSGSGRKPHLVVHAPKTNRTRKVNLSISPLAHCILENLKVTGSDYLFLPHLKDRSNPIILYRKFTRHLVRVINKKTQSSLEKVTPKDFRSSHVALLASIKGWDIFKVAKQLGHSATIANQSYTEEIQMMDYPSGDTIEQVAGLEDIGLRIVKANGMNPQITEDLNEQRTLAEKLNESTIKHLLGEAPSFKELVGDFESYRGRSWSPEEEETVMTILTELFAKKMTQAKSKTDADKLTQEYFGLREGLLKHHGL